MKYFCYLSLALSIASSMAMEKTQTNSSTKNERRITCNKSTFADGKSKYSFNYIKPALSLPDALDLPYMLTVDGSSTVRVAEFIQFINAGKKSEYTEDHQPI